MQRHRVKKFCPFRRAAGVGHVAADEHEIERISGMVDETTTAAKEISIATQQQRSASDQVVSAMTQVSDVSRQYAVGSKQAAAAAELVRNAEGNAQNDGR